MASLRNLPVRIEKNTLKMQSYNRCELNPLSIPFFANIQPFIGTVCVNEGVKMA